MSVSVLNRTASSLVILDPSLSEKYPGRSTLGKHMMDSSTLISSRAVTSEVYSGWSMIFSITSLASSRSSSDWL